MQDRNCTILSRVQDNIARRLRIITWNTCDYGAFSKLRNLLTSANCIVITNSEEAELKENGIEVKVLPAREWMLE